MAAWWTRWFGGAGTAPVAPARPAPSAAPARPPAKPAKPAGPAERQPAEAAHALTTPGAGVGTRRPLLGRDGRLAGFEFGLAGPLFERALQRGDEVAQAAHAAALLAATAPVLAAQRVALVVLPLALAARPAVIAQVQPGLLLALPAGPHEDLDAPAALALMAALRRAGARLGGVGAAITGGSFVLLEGHRPDAAALASAVAAARRGQPALQVVATGLGSIELLEAALAQGVDFAAGEVDRSSAPRDPAPMPPRLQRLCQLLNRLVQEAELAALAQDLRTDVDLSYRLLRHANSPWVGLSRPAESVEQAVLLLGRDGLYRWLSLLLMAGADARPSSRALQEVALARARLLESLAPALGAPPAALFTTGLLSLLDVMLRQPIDAALAPLQLPAPAMQALVEQAGPWRPALELAQAMERSDGATAAALAPAFGGLDAATLQADAAWRWAADAAAGST